MNLSIACLQAGVFRPAGNNFEVIAFADIAITNKNLIMKVQSRLSNFFDLDINILYAIFLLGLV